MIALICRRRRARGRSREGERARMLRRTPERPVTGRGRKHASPCIGPAAGRASVAPRALMWTFSARRGRAGVRRNAKARPGQADRGPRLSRKVDREPAPRAPRAARVRPRPNRGRGREAPERRERVRPHRVARPGRRTARSPRHGQSGHPCGRRVSRGGRRSRARSARTTSRTARAASRSARRARRGFAGRRSARFLARSALATLRSARFTRRAWRRVALSARRRRRHATSRAASGQANQAIAAAPAAANAPLLPASTPCQVPTAITGIVVAWRSHRPSLTVVSGAALRVNARPRSRMAWQAARAHRPFPDRYVQPFTGGPRVPATSTQSCGLNPRLFSCG